MTHYDILNAKSIPMFVTDCDKFSDYFTITPAVAQDVVNNHMYGYQRKLSALRINQFARAMKDGTFAPVSTVTFAVNGKTFSCIDGQHTLRAQMKSNTTLVLPVLIIKGEESKLYSKIDRGKSRTQNDTLRAHDFASVMDLTPDATNRVASAMKIIVAGYTRHHAYVGAVSEEVLMERMREYKDEASRCMDVLKGLNAKALKARLSLSMFLTLYKELPEHKVERVDEFLRGCATDDGLPVGDARKLIYTMYATRTRYGGKRGGSISPENELGNLLCAWSAFYTGASCKRNFSHKRIDQQLSKVPNLMGTGITFTLDAPVPVR